MYFEESKKYILNKIQDQPEFGIFLLGNQFNQLIEEINNPISISYQEIPIMKKKSNGILVFGNIVGKKIVFFVFNNIDEEIYRNHYSILICKSIGIKKLILINISMGVNSNYKMGDIMFIKDHINFFPEENSLKKILKGKSILKMEPPYDQSILETAENIAMNHNILIQKGIYVASPYYNYKTYAEYAMIRSIGGDCVGMNIVSDVMTAKYMNLRVFALSLIMMMELMNNDDHHMKKNNLEMINFSIETKKSISILILIIKELIKNC